MLNKRENNCININHNCYLCDQPSSTMLCRGCQHDLPWLTHCCAVCALPLATHSSALICGQCLRKPPDFAACQAAFHYQFPINPILPAIKQRRQLYHLNWLCAALVTRLRATPQAWPDIIMPIPSHASRLLWRGFNPPSLIARQLSSRLSIPVNVNSLRKSIATPHQMGMPAKARKRNLKNAFTYQGRRYRHVVLVDDIMTTGTTLNEAARTLHQQGIERVDCWVLARTPPPH